MRRTYVLVLCMLTFLAGSLITMIDRVIAQEVEPVPVIYCNTLQEMIDTNNVFLSSDISRCIIQKYDNKTAELESRIEIVENRAGVTR